jgi:hypothetical protein
VEIFDLLWKYYVRRCPLSELCLICTIFQELAVPRLQVIRIITVTFMLLVTTFWIEPRTF